MRQGRSFLRAVHASLLAIAGLACEGPTIDLPLPRSRTPEPDTDETNDERGDDDGDRTPPPCDDSADCRGRARICFDDRFCVECLRDDDCDDGFRCDDDLECEPRGRS